MTVASSGKLLAAFLGITWKKGREMERAKALSRTFHNGSMFIQGEL